MRLGEIAGVPLDDDAVKSGLAGIAEQDGLLHSAFLAGPLDVLRQDDWNVAWIGQRARGVVDGRLGALRTSDRDKCDTAESRGDRRAEDHHSGETHTGILPVNNRP